MAEPFFAVGTRALTSDSWTCSQGCEIVWFEEFYDGPLTGVARYNDHLYWFTPAASDWHRERPRRFVLREMAESELEQLEERREASETLDSDAYWTRYHPLDRDRHGFQAHDGEPVGLFTA